MNLRRAARIDANQPEIVKALRSVGALVLHMGHPVDLMVGFSGRWFAIEIKDPSKPPSKRTLTDDQQEFFDLCRPRLLPVYRVETIEEALQAIGAKH
jgi:hypothetical protein